MDESAATTGHSEKPAWDRLPQVRTSLPDAEVIRILERLARDGKLAGFQAPSRAGLFEVGAFGEPFDRRLAARRDSSGAKLTFRATLLARMPLIYALVIAVSIWPGVWLTHSMLSTYWTWYGQWPEWVTWAWYMPITVIPLLFAIPKIVRKSERACYEHAMEQTSKIAEALGGTLEGP